MIDKQQLFLERGQYCDCGCGQFAHDAHHALIHRNKRFSTWLDDPRNLILVNHDEHISRKFDNIEWRRRFWARQILRYGETSMFEWLNDMPQKMDRARIDWL
jgi:hypothetical protein